MSLSTVPARLTTTARHNPSSRRALPTGSNSTASESPSPRPVEHAAAWGWADPPCRVLVVEDNRDTAESLQLLLEHRGHPVKVAYAGPDGVQAARTWHPDAVLCDIGLPGLDGYGVARELRADPATAHARLIAVTGYGSEDDRRRALDSGFDFHLTKPADPAVIERLLTLDDEPPALC